MVTDEELDRAAAALDAAESALHGLTTGPRRLWPTREAGTALAGARGRVELATMELQRLLDQRSAEQADIAARPELEKAAAKHIAAAGRDLEAGAGQLTAAVNAAQAALVQLAAAAAAQNELVRLHSAELVARGLPQNLHGHGQETGGSSEGVRVRGQWWMPVNVGTLVAWVNHRAHEAREGRSPGLNAVFLRKWADQRTGGLLAGVEPLPQGTRPTRARWGRQVVDGAPVGIPEYKRELIERDAANAYQVFEGTKGGPRRVDTSK